MTTIDSTATAEDQAMARRAGVPLDVLLAIRANESRGNVRAVRFEPHVFHRLTGNRYLQQVPGQPGVVSHVASQTSRSAFERARGYDEAAAIRSTSWGAYQVLGGHLLSLYPSSPVRAFDANPTRVGRQMLVDWFRGNPRAVAAAQARDIPLLARLYNGSVVWGQRVGADLAEIRRQGVRIQGAAAEIAPYILLLGAGVAFAGWAYWRSKK